MLPAATLRPMTQDDLDRVRRWLGEPHVARWWPPDLDACAECEKFRRRIRGELPTRMLVICEAERPIGWCQWYRWGDYPQDAKACGARADDVGIDYAIGEPHCTGRGLGTAMIAALLREVPRDAAVVSTPHARNAASRRVLEKNGFRLVATRELCTEPVPGMSAIYRLSARSRSPGTPARR